MSSSKNEYLKLREEKILRNQQKLETLGLAGSYADVTTDHHHHPNHHPNHHDYDSPKQHDKKRNRENTNASLMHVRRSSRSMKQAVVSYKDPDAVWYAERELGISIRQRRNSSPKLKRDTENTFHENISKQKQMNVGPKMRSEIIMIRPGTTRSVSVSIPAILYGRHHPPQEDPCATTYIGQYLSTPNKAAVIEHANLQSGNPPGISFNKYSGVCEFQNDVIFLWVNIGFQGDVVNEFLEGGRKMTWYGGSKMTQNSPILQRLIHIGQEAYRNNGQDSGIVLWCRMYHDSSSSNDASSSSCHTKGFSPYICMGRLGYISHDPASYPVQFIWELLDYDVLKRTRRKDRTISKEETETPLLEKLMQLATSISNPL